MQSEVKKAVRLNYHVILL